MEKSKGRGRKTEGRQEKEIEDNRSVEKNTNEQTEIAKENENVYKDKTSNGLNIIKLVKDKEWKEKKIKWHNKKKRLQVTGKW